MRISDWISDVCSSDLTGFSYRKLSNRTRSAGGAIATKRLIRKARNRNCGRPSRSAGANSPDRVQNGPAAVLLADHGDGQRPLDAHRRVVVGHPPPRTGRVLGRHLIEDLQLLGQGLLRPGTPRLADEPHAACTREGA